MGNHDEFDLDIRFMGNGGIWASEQPQQEQEQAFTGRPTCPRHTDCGTCPDDTCPGQTCANTCAGQNTCPNTQCNTCANTCPNTCANTCQATCNQATCDTCHTCTRCVPPCP